MNNNTTMNFQTARHNGEHLTNIDITKILAFDKVKTSQREIVHFIKCSRGTIQNILGTYLFETFQGRNHQCTYQRKTTQREDRYIERALMQNCSMPLHDITNIINSRGLPVSETTVRC